jgi:hypothetical protein
MLEALIQRFVGLELWGFGQAADMMIFKIGPKFEVKDSHLDGLFTIGLFHLHLQCCCRIISKNRILLGNFDVYNPPTGYSKTEDFDWLKARDNRFLEVCRKTFNGNYQHIISSVQVGRMGRFDLNLSTGLTLEVFPVQSFKRREQWRILEHKVAHYVFENFALEVHDSTASEE